MQIILQKRVVFFLLTLPFFLWKCGVNLNNEDEIVARIGNSIITKEDFILSYELTPRFMGTKTGDDPKQSHLQWIINRKLLAREGRKLGLLHDPQIETMLQWKEKRAVIKELYRNLVQQNITMPENELREAFKKFNQEVRARHLFFKSQDEAINVYETLIAGEVSFEEMAQKTFEDSTLAETGGDLGFFTWGDMDPDFGSTAFSLQIGEISKPIKTKWGYHIIQIVDKNVNLIVTESEFDRRRSYLEKTIRKRKQDSLAHEYVKEFMLPKNVVMKGPTFALLCSLFVKPESDNKQKLPNLPPRLQDPEITILQNLGTHKNAVLITFDGGQWTIADFIKIIKSLPVNERPRISSRKTFENDIGIVVRDEFLAKEAFRRRLHNQPNVHQEVNEWQENILATKIWGKIKNQIQIVDHEIQDYIEKLPGAAKISYHDARQKILNQRSAEAVNKLLAKLMAEVHVEINRNLLAKIETIDRGSKRQIDVMAVPLSN